MKRWLPAGLAVLIGLMAAAILFAEAIDPGEFTGHWYSCRDNRLYTFQNGLISCEDQGCRLLNGELFSGAYVFSAKRLLLFANGIEGLETEKELYLVRRNSEDLLCENQNGTGRVFFYRETAITEK